jgi:hypothetical protein
MHSRRTELRDLLRTEEKVSHYYLSGRNSDTRDPLFDTKAFNSESPNFKYQAENHSF